MVQIAQADVNRTDVGHWSEESDEFIRDHVSYFTIDFERLDRSDPTYLLISSKQASGPTIAATFPLWTVALVTGAYPLGYFLVTRRRKTRWRNEHRCSSCGYCLLGTENDRCPECGREASKAPIVNKAIPLLVVVIAFGCTLGIVSGGLSAPTTIRNFAKRLQSGDNEKNTGQIQKADVEYFARAMMEREFRLTNNVSGAITILECEQDQEHKDRFGVRGTFTVNVSPQEPPRSWHVVIEVRDGRQLHLTRAEIDGAVLLGED